VFGWPLYRLKIYTGITRGKRLLVLIGQKKALGIAVRNGVSRSLSASRSWGLRPCGNPQGGNGPSCEPGWQPLEPQSAKPLARLIFFPTHLAYPRPARPHPSLCNSATTSSLISSPHGLTMTATTNSFYACCCRAPSC